MLLHHLFEDLVPPKIRSYLMGKAVGIAAEAVRTKYNSNRAIFVDSPGASNTVWVTFNMYLGSHVGVASFFKKALKDNRLSPYTDSDKENVGDSHEYTFEFGDFRWDEYNPKEFLRGFQEIPHGHGWLTIDAGKGEVLKLERQLK